MSIAWPKVRLGEVLWHRKESITIDDLATYKRPRVRLYAQGIVLRDEVLGAAVKTKTQQVCHAGEFLVAEIDAKVGGFGIVPDALDGSIVSSHYFLFVVDEAKLDRHFLDYFIRTPAFRDQVEAQGSTNYAAIRPAHVIGYETPLPPLAEQQQIVARIEELAAKIEEARRLRQSNVQDQRRMLSSVFAGIVSDAPQLPMREVAPLVRRPVHVDPDGQYPELGIRSHGMGTFHKPAIPGILLGSKRLYEMRPGDLVFNNVFAWEGAVAVVRREDAGRFGSHRFITCVPSERVYTPGFLCFYFLTAEGTERLGKASPGGAGRNRTLGLAALAEIRVPVVGFSDQLWFDNLQAKVQELDDLQTETNNELDALLPSILDKAFKGEL